MEDIDKKPPAHRSVGDLTPLESHRQLAPTTRQFLGILFRAGTAGLNRHVVEAAIQPALESLATATSREEGLTLFHREASEALEAAMELVAEAPGAEFHAGIDLAKSDADLFAEIGSITKHMSDDLAHHATNEVRRPNVEALIGANNGRLRIELNILQLKLIFATERLSNDRASSAARAAFLDALAALLERLKTSFLAD